MIKKIITITIVALFLATCVAGAVSTNVAGTDSEIDSYIRGIKYDPLTDVAAHSGAKQLPCEFTGSDSGTVTVKYELMTAESGSVEVLANSKANKSIAYPGALIKGDKYLADNAPNPVVSADRADMNFYIDLPISNSGFTANPANPEKVYNAIYAKCDEWAKSGKAISYDGVYEYSQAMSSSELKVDFNLTAEALQGLGLGLNWTQSAKETVTVIKYTQIFYTVSVSTSSLQSNPSNYFGKKTTLEDLKYQIKDHQQAVLVDTVSYGRTVVATVTSKSSANDVDMAISAAIAGTDESLSGGPKKALEESTVSMYIFGGPTPENTPKTIEGFIDYIADSSITIDNISTAEPVQYTTRWIDSGDRATSQSTAEYNAMTVTETKAIDFSIHFDGAYEEQIWLYYTTYDYIDTTGKKINERNVEQYYGKYTSGAHKYFTITAKHNTDFYITVHAYGGQDVCTKALITPLDTIHVEHGGGICTQSFTLQVDGKTVLTTEKK